MLRRQLLKVLEQMQKENHPASDQIAEVSNHPKRLKQLIASVKDMASKNGQEQLISAADALPVTTTPKHPILANLFKWLWDHKEEIAKFIGMIIAIIPK